VRRIIEINMQVKDVIILCFFITIVLFKYYFENRTIISAKFFEHLYSLALLFWNIPKKVNTHSACH